MQTASAAQDYSLTMNRNLNASKQEVYDAWTNPEALTSWFAASSEMSTIVHKLELHVGGHYRIEMLEPNGTSHVMHGEYIALDPYNQLVFTWEWESEEQNVNSLVTIDLTESKDSTNMLLTHEKFDSQDLADLHSEGWTGCLAQLEEFFN